MRTSTPAAALALLATLAAVTVSPAAAQLSNDQIMQQRQIFGLWLPLASQRASVSQTIGVADVEIIYHRPSVNDREIWGGLVPLGQVWRTGANENTLISFSQDVTVQGEPLAAGVYGLHTIPGADEWQIIFSRDNTAWGSFSYDESQDALRVTARPEAAPHRELMTFSFDEVTADSAVAALHWEKVRVPLEIKVDAHAQTIASIEKQLKGLAQFNWVGWNQAASYALTNDLDLDRALAWVDNSIQAEERFDNLNLKSQILEKKGDVRQAAELHDRALAMANAGQLHNLGRQLLGQGKKEEALAIFERNVRQNPDAWFVEVGLARGYAALGRWDDAVESMKIAHGKAPEAQKAYIQGLVDRLERQESI